MTRLSAVQVKAIRNFIANAERFMRFSDGSYIRGPITWSIEHTGDGRVWVRGDNITELAWYETCFSVNALVGLRGGVKVYSVRGLEKRYLTN